MPLSVYPLLVQALRNDINKRFLTDDFDTVLGKGARAGVAAMVRERFNMYVNDMSGRKVGLLDRHHLMTFLCDPCCMNGMLTSIFKPSSCSHEGDD